MVAMVLVFTGANTAIVIAAEIRVNSELPLKAEVRGAGDCQISLTGEIVKGDAARLAETYQRLEPPLLEGDPYWGQSGDGFDLCLDSPGGLLSEGILIARYLREKSIGTYLPKDATCVSACAIAFFGGSMFVDDRSDLYIMHAQARLGLHAPSLTLNADLSKLPAEVLQATIDNAYKSAVADIREISQTLVEPSRGTSSLSPALLIEMLSTPPDEVFWIETINHAGLYNIPIAGAIASLPLTQEVLIRGCNNLLNWSENLPAGNYDQSSFIRSNINISQIKDSRTRGDEEAWQFEEISTWAGGLRNSSCTYFIKKGAGTISWDSLRIDVYNSRADDSNFIWRAQPWMFLDAETALREVAAR